MTSRTPLGPRALSIAGALAAVLAAIHLMGALGENTAGHHAHVGSAAEATHHGTTAPAHASGDVHGSQDSAHHDESGSHGGHEGDPHPDDDSHGSCGYSTATSTLGGAVDFGGVGDPSTLVLEAARRRCTAHPGRHAVVRTPNLVKDLQVIRV